MGQLLDLCIPIVPLAKLGATKDAAGQETDVAQPDRSEVHDPSLLLLFHGEYPHASFCYIC